MNTHDLDALTGVYAADALHDADRFRFEEHLATCQLCRVEVAELRETAALLADLAPVAPPARVRDAVLDAISVVRPLPPVLDGPVDRPDHLASARGRRRIRWWLVSIAAAVVLAAGTATAGHLAADRPPASVSVIEQVLDAADAQSVGVELADGGTVRVVRSTRHRTAVLVADDLAAPPSGRVYQLWLRDGDGEMTPAGMLPSGGDHQVVLTGDAAPVAAVGITVEPAGGSRQPTTAPIAYVSLKTAV